MYSVEVEGSKWKEECGVYGVYSHEMDVSGMTYLGLYSLQHRGQESAGIAITDGAWMDVTRGMGLVNEVFRHQVPHMTISILLLAMFVIPLPAPACWLIPSHLWLTTLAARLVWLIMVI